MLSGCATEQSDPSRDSDSDTEVIGSIVPSSIDYDVWTSG